jgi:hypothetical protein
VKYFKHLRRIFYGVAFFTLIGSILVTALGIVVLIARFCAWRYHDQALETTILLLVFYLAGWIVEPD